MQCSICKKTFDAGYSVHGVDFCQFCDASDTEVKKEKINHPAHYNTNKPPCIHCGGLIECIDIVTHMSFNIGNSIKYIWRAAYKNNGLEDLKKAAWYLEHEIKKLEK